MQPIRPVSLPLPAACDVFVVGGGPAGSSTAIHLAHSGLSVVLAERRRYPAHRLCGEFLSTEASAMLARLGVLKAVDAAGAHRIHRAQLTSATGRVLEVPLPGTALGLSRLRLDSILFEQARDRGVAARDGCSVTGVELQADGSYRVETTDGDVQARLVIGAHGKRSRLDGRLNRPFLKEHSPLVGFKAHFEGDGPGDCIEMHAFPGGYGGLSQVEGGRVNVCWLAHADALREGGGSPEGMIDRVLVANPHLARRMAALERVSDRFEAVAQVHLRPKGLFDGGVCMVGDTAAMITPLCGDGMAMALQSAEIAAPLASMYLRGKLSRAAFEAAYERVWKQHFARRLRFGRLLHHAFSAPRGSDLLVAAGRLLPALSSWFVRQTRGG